MITYELYLDNNQVLEVQADNRDHLKSIIRRLKRSKLFKHINGIKALS